MKLLTQQQVQRVRARVDFAVKILQKVDPSLQLTIETLTELSDDLLAELRLHDLGLMDRQKKEVARKRERLGVRLILIQQEIKRLDEELE